MPPVAVVAVTRHRAGALRHTLDALWALPQRPRVIVVDNRLSDGTPALVRVRHPDVDVVEVGGLSDAD